MCLAQLKAYNKNAVNPLLLCTDVKVENESLESWSTRGSPGQWPL